MQSWDGYCREETEMEARESWEGGVSSPPAAAHGNLDSLWGIVPTEAHSSGNENSEQWEQWEQWAAIRQSHSPPLFFFLEATMASLAMVHRIAESDTTEVT